MSGLRRIALPAVVLLIALAACSDGTGSETPIPTTAPPISATAPAAAPPTATAAPEPLQIVVTNNIVADWVENVGGDRVEVFSLLPIGADPHTFQPGAKDVARVADADLVLSIGLGLEESWLHDLIENAKGDESAIIELGEAIDPIEFGATHAGEVELLEEIAHVVHEVEDGEIDFATGIEEIKHLLAAAEGEEEEEHGHHAAEEELIEMILDLIAKIESGEIDAEEGIEELHHLAEEGEGEVLGEVAHVVHEVEDGEIDLAKGIEEIKHLLAEGEEHGHHSAEEELIEMILDLIAKIESGEIDAEEGIEELHHLAEEGEGEVLGEVAHVVHEVEDGEIDLAKGIEEIKHLLAEGEEHGHHSAEEELIKTVLDIIAKVESGQMAPDEAIEELHHLAEEGEDAHAGHGHGIHDPHFWFDPIRVKTAINDIAARLTALDADGGDTYSANASAYNARLDELHSWTEQQVATVPADHRLLVTSHDSLGYFAELYGFVVVGVILSFTTDVDPSPSDLAHLADEIKEYGVPAVFGETTVSERLATALAGETGAKLVRLYSGSLGEEGSGADTYIGMVRTNVERITEALK